MEQHPIPRQITTFEFKLIGFMTLKQFLYILVSVPAGFIVFRLFPIPIINLLMGLTVIGLGVALAFLPVNDRPLDVWIKNLFKRLSSPTQYAFHKNNSPLYFLEDLYFVSDPHRVVSHVESREKLAAYLEKTQPKKAASVKKNQINSLLKTPTSQMRPIHVKVEPPASPAQFATAQTEAHQPPVRATSQQPQEQPAQTTKAPPQSAPAPRAHGGLHPFFTGVIKNARQIPLPGILVYVKNERNIPIRLLKTNPHGVFATYSPLPEGQYVFELKDPNGGYLFDTMNLHVPNERNKPFELYSK